MVQLFRSKKWKLHVSLEAKWKLKAFATDQNVHCSLEGNGEVREWDLEKRPSSSGTVWQNHVLRTCCLCFSLLILYIRKKIKK